MVFLFKTSASFLGQPLDLERAFFSLYSYKKRKGLNKHLYFLQRIHYMEYFPPLNSAILVDLFI